MGLCALNYRVQVHVSMSSGKNDDIMCEDQRTGEPDFFFDDDDERKWWWSSLRSNLMMSRRVVEEKELIIMMMCERERSWALSEKNQNGYFQLREEETTQKAREIEQESGDWLLLRIQYIYIYTIYLRMYEYLEKPLSSNFLVIPWLSPISSSILSSKELKRLEVLLSMYIVCI